MRLRHNNTLFYLILILFSTFYTSTAFAHKINIDAWIENRQIHIIGKFSGGKGVVDGIVEVKNAKGDVVAEGKTDKNGKLSLPIPDSVIRNKSDLTVVLNAGSGHKNSFLIYKSDLDGLTVENGEQTLEQTSAPAVATDSKKPKENMYNKKNSLKN